MERALDVERGIGTKHHTAGIKQIQMRPWKSGLQCAINLRPLPTRDATQDMRDPRGPREVGRIIGAHTKTVKAMKQIGAVVGPRATRNRVGMAVRSHGGAEGAIGGQGGAYLRLAHGQPEHQEKAATAEPRDTAVSLRGHGWMTEHHGAPFPRARRPPRLGTSPWGDHNQLLSNRNGAQKKGSAYVGSLSTVSWAC